MIPFDVIDGVEVPLEGDRLTAYLDGLNNTQAPLPDLTMRQFRLGLLSAGLLAGVEAAIAALPEPDQSAARIEFEYASVVIRTDPWVTDLAAIMNLTDQEIDSLWLWASTL